MFVGVLCVFVCVFVCSLRHPKSNSNTPYSYLWPLRPFHIFPHYLINCTNLGGRNLLGVKCLLWSSLQLLSETFSILRRN